MAETNVGFEIPRSNVEVKPLLLCKGYVDGVDDVQQPKEDGLYLNIPFRIKGLAGSRGAFVRIYFRPEWFAPGFKPDFKAFEGTPHPTRPEKDLAASLSGCCKMGVWGTYNPKTGKGTPSILQGLAGSWENFVELVKNIFEAYQSVPAPKDDVEQDGYATATAQAVQGAIKKFFVSDNQGIPFGYEMKQAKRDGELTEDYEVGSIVWLDADGKQEKAWERRVKNATDNRPVKWGYERD